MYSRKFTPPKSSYFLFGPRGAGKSTFLRKHYPEATYINLLDERKYQSYLSDPGQFYQEVALLEPKSTVIVDEIQRLPPLLNEVHRLIEENKLKFILSGSSARKLRKAGVNLLAGRVLKKALHPFLPEELKKDFKLSEALQFGLIPIVFSAEDKKETLEAYTQTYLKEEIQAEALVRNLSGFARFLPVAALMHGQRLSLSSLARDSGVARSTIESFFSILEDTLVGFQLPAYEGKLRVRVKKRPKFYFIDAGLVRALKKQYGGLAHEEIGPLFEGLIGQILRAYKDYNNLFDEWYCWSPAEAKQTEVDFLLKKENKFIAIECKSGKKLSSKDLKGLRAISDLKGLHRKILVFNGESSRKIDDIEALTLNDFLSLLSKNKLWL